MKTINLNAGSQDSKSEVLLELSPFGRDWILSIRGGEAHIGAIACSVAGQEDISYTLPGHKEEVIVNLAISKISSLVQGNLLVVSGIHYDDITQQQINDIIINTEQLLNQLVDIIHSS